MLITLQKKPGSFFQRVINKQRQQRHRVFVACGRLCFASVFTRNSSATRQTRTAKARAPTSNSSGAARSRSSSRCSTTSTAQASSAQAPTSAERVKAPSPETGRAPPSTLMPELKTPPRRLSGEATRLTSSPPRAQVERERPRSGDRAKAKLEA